MRILWRSLLLLAGVCLAVALGFCVMGMAAACAKGSFMGGQHAYAAGRYAEAARAFRTASLLGLPSERERAAALYHLGQLGEAERLLRRQGDDPNAAVPLGVVLMAQGRDAEAEASFRSVLDHRAGRPLFGLALASYNLSLLYNKHGDAARARKAYRDALAWSVGEAATWSGPQPVYSIKLSKP